MSEWEIMMLQYKEVRAGQKEAQRKREALTGGKNRLYDAILDDVGRLLLSMDPTVDPEVLSDEKALRELLREKFCGRAWTREPGRLVYDPEAARFRAIANVVVKIVDDWITAERERCASIQECRDRLNGKD